MPSVAANGLTLEYESFGDPAQPVVLLVMGLGVQMILWPEALCRMLAEGGFRVVRFDNRDAGLSSQMDHLGKPRIGLETLKFLLRLPVKSAYSLDDMARDTAGLIDALSLGRVHVVGASMGAMIGQNLAAMLPGKVATLTSIMSTTGSRKLPQPTWRARRALLERPPRRGDFEGAVRRLVKLLRAIGSRSFPADGATLREVCERHVSRGYNPSAIARQLTAIAAADDRTAVVAAIRAPTLVIHGDEDPLIPARAGAETARVIAASGVPVEYRLLKGMGHDLPVPLLPDIAAAILGHCRRYQ